VADDLWENFSDKKKKEGGGKRKGSLQDERKGEHTGAIFSRKSLTMWGGKKKERRKKGI